MNLIIRTVGWLLVFIFVNCAVAGDRVAALQQKAINGDPDAQFNLALMYDNGNDIPVDKKKAIVWYIKAAEQGVMAAQYNLAVMYENGQGTSVNNKKAIKWYTKAAEQGFAQAQYYLSRFYLQGDGVPVDMQKYLELLTKSANQGHMMAQFRLGVFYSEGENVTGESIKKSIDYYTKAAMQDHMESQAALAILYWRCREISDCRMKAYIWCALAKEKKPETTEDFLELIEDTMTTREISTAQSAASLVKKKINNQ